MTDSDKTEDEFVQFVCFKTAGPVPVDLFQHSWIPAAEGLFTRGINTVIFSEKLPLSGDLGPYKFIAKNCWASIKAIKGTFPTGVPSPCSRGHITVSQGGIFKLVHVAKGDGTKLKHNSVYKGGFKALTMMPLLDEPLSKDTVMTYADYLISLTGFETLGVYKLHNSSGPASEWLYEWIIEAFFNSVNATEESVLKDLMNCPMATKKWEISIHKDYMQMVG
ncbi:hypothetical protein OS493_023421 [Desmophyllum pertusum]|uniref:Uncharacterized protein n=1 Tax=Desmophyllum pertusum TaxID=174260 RepID=A0A9W9ZNK6_9CNID|nr:hypothetical protein OS493_023421 [Desmophyllum pertusum]